MEEKTPIKEHILVCLSSSPSNPKVIYAASKMAKVFNADFTALFIETSKFKKMTNENKKRLNDNTNLARQQNAKIVTIDGDDIASLVSQYSQKSGVTKIVIGRSGYKPNRFFSPPNFVDKLLELTPEIEIHVIPDKSQKIYMGQIQTTDKDNKFFSLSAKDTLKSILIITLATIIGEVFFKFNMNEANIILIYILSVFLISYVTERKIYSLISSLLAVLIFNFFFTAPYYTLNTNDPRYFLTFCIMFIVAFFTSNIIKKIKEQSKEASLKAYSTGLMLEMSQKLMQSQNETDIIKTTIEQIKKLMSCDVILLPVVENKLSESNKNVIEFDVAKWSYQNNQPAGASTKNYPEAKNFYLPISNINNVFAIIVINKKDINEFEKNILIAMLREAALAYEKNLISQIKNQLILKNKQEEIRSTLLRAISHDLRTPLTGISGFADILMKNSQILNEDKKQQIYSDIYDDSVWLLNLIENILSITKFDKNEIKINKESEYISDIIEEALSHLGRKKENYNIQTEIEDESLSVKIDAQLITQVVFNLIDNAMKYSPTGTKIIIKAEECDKKVKISVIDEGNGINDNDKIKIFDAFYTCNNSSVDSRRGLGLGLALCKTIIEAHGGKIEIKDNYPKGSIFSFVLNKDNHTNFIEEKL